MALSAIWLAMLGAMASAGVLTDVLARRLPNILCALMVLAGLTLALAADGWAAAALQLVHALLALAVGYGLFVARVWGGGDGKFYAAAASFFPLAQMANLFAAISLAGLVLATVWSALRRGQRSNSAPLDAFTKLPYGIAIAAGALGLGWMSMA